MATFVDVKCAFAWHILNSQIIAPVIRDGGSVGWSCSWIMRSEWASIMTVVWGGRNVMVGSSVIDVRPAGINWLDIGTILDVFAARFRISRIRKRSWYLRWMCSYGACLEDRDFERAGVRRLVLRAKV